MMSYDVCDVTVMARDGASMDWSGVLEAIPRDVESSEVEADELYNFLSNAGRPPERESEKLLKILEVALAVMKFKGDQASAYFEELVQGGPAGGGSNERGDLPGRVGQLEEELRQRDKTIRELQDSSSGHMQAEVRRLRDENSDLRREIDRLKREGERDRDEVHRLLGDLDNTKGRLRDVEAQRDDLRRDVDDYKSQVQWQAQSLSVSQQGGAGAGHYKELLRSKDRKLNETLDEVEKLATANEALEGEITGLTSKLGQVEKGRLELMEQMQSLREAIRDSDMKRGDTESKNKIMKGQIEDLTLQVQQTRKSDEDIMTIVNTKAAEWEGLLNKKEVELRESRHRVGELEQQLRAASGSSDKRTVTKLTKELQAREEEVRALRSELSDATHHLEELTDQLQQAQHQVEKRGGAGGSRELQGKVNQLERALEIEREQRKQSDVDKVAVEGELAFVSRRLREYETGEYGLGEAVAEIKRRKEDIALRDRQVSQLTEEVNRLSAQVDTACEENEVLRNKLGLSAGEEVDASHLRHRKNVEIEQLRAVNRELDKQVQKLEEERVDLRQQLLVTAKVRAQRAVELGLTTESLVSVEEYAERLRADTRHTLSPPPSPYRVHGDSRVKEEREEEASRLKRELGSTRKALERAQQDKEALERELHTCKGSLSGSVTKMKNLDAKISSLKQDNARLKQQLKAAKRHTQTQQGLESVDGQPTPPLEAGDRGCQHEEAAAKALEVACSQWKTHLKRLLLLATVGNDSGAKEHGKPVQHTSEIPADPDDRVLLSQLHDSLIQLTEKEKAARRKVEILQGESSSLQQRLTCLHMSSSSSQPAATASWEERGSTHLQQWKVGAEAKMDQLQAEVQRRVPREELEVLEEQFTDLSTKYQRLVQHHDLLVGRAEAAESGAGQEAAPLLERSKALEEQCCELTVKVLEMQRAEGQLRRELAEAVPRETHEDHLRRCQAEKEELRVEVLKLKESEDIVQQQCFAMATISQSYEQEISLLKQQLLELQSQTDDRVIIAKLTQKVTALQTSEASALQQLSSAQARLASRESALLKAEREVDDVKREVELLKERHHRKLELEQRENRSLQRRYRSGVMSLTALQPTVRHVGEQDSTQQRSSQQELQLAGSPTPSGPQLLRETLHPMAVQVDQHGGQAQSAWGKVDEGVKGDRFVPGRMQSELDHARLHAKQLESALQETKDLLVTREKEMAELRVLLSQQIRSPALQPSSAPPTASTITQLQLTASREQDLQALLVAQQTIADLRDIISQKESLVNKYQSLLQQARRETQSLTGIHAAEMAQLTRKLHKEQEQAFERFKQTSLETLHHLPSSEVPLDQLTVRVKELEETLAHRERERAVLEERLKGSLEDQQHASQQYQGHIKRLREEMNHLEQEHQLRAKQFENVIADKARKVLNLETEIEVMEGELRAAREAAHKSPARTTQDLVERLKNDMAAKEKQYKALSAALVEVRAELIEVTQRAVEEKGGRKKPGEEEEEEGLCKMLENKTEELQGQVSQLSAQLSSLHEEADREREVHQKNLSLIDELQEKLLDRDALVASLRSEVQSRNKVLEQVKAREKKAEAEIETLRRRLETNTETDELRKHIEVLQVRVEREKQRSTELETALKAAHGSATSMPSPPSSRKGRSTVNNKHSSEEVIRWEESKKWQKKLATLRAKLTDKSQEVEEVRRQSKSLRETIERSDRERSALQVKLKSAQRALSESLNVPHPRLQGQEENASKGGGEGGLATLSALAEHKVIHELKSRVYELENEVSSLQLRLSAAQQAESCEWHAAQALLQSTLSEVRAQLTDAGTGALVGRVGELQAQLLQCQKENMELQFELEQAITSVPRMKAHIVDLEEFVAVLRKAVSDAEKTAKPPTSGEGKSSTSKSVLELERVINAMKNVIEKLRSENSDLKQQMSLKSAPTKGSSRDSSAKVKEMEALIARAAAENEKYLTELKQERERVCALQSKVSSLEAAEHKKKEREREASKESAVREDRISRMQDELDKKSEMLKEIKIHLQDAAKREERLTLLEDSRGKLAILMKEREQLRQKNEQLQRELDSFDPSFFEEIEDLKYNYHQSQQTIARYEQQLQELCRQFGVPLPDV